MASKPKILTIIPAYNAARFLRETVNSILNQKGADINLIIIDDKSTDDTLKIAHSIKEATVFNNTENKGNYYSGNLILSKYLKDNSWDYYCFHGADDISHSNRFIKQLDLFDDNTLAVGCRFQRMDYKTRRNQTS
jgi:glycosyltransferase involved in cell wall biosynthesis